MLHLILGRLYADAALLPGKIDARLRQIAAVVNGGLTGDNLAAAYKIPVTSFRERYSYFALQARLKNANIDGGGGVNPIAFTPPVPMDCELIGVTVWLAGMYESWTPRVYRGRYYSLTEQLAGVVFERTDGVGPYPDAGGADYHRTTLVAKGFAPITVYVGYQLWFTLDVAGHTGHAVFHFRVPHVQ